MMEIAGGKFRKVDVYDISVTVPDCYVCAENKTGKGNGEAKLYMGPKGHMRQFYAGNKASEGFKVKCVVLKKDLLEYMRAIRHEYENPSIKYRGTKRNSINSLWRPRKEEIEALPDHLIFDITDQAQIKGARGYVNTRKPLEGAYGILRKIALPFVSYISVMKLQNEQTGELLFYWKLFADFSQMAEMQYAAKNYGRKKSTTSRRDGQYKYRQELLEEFHCCPFTQIDDIRLLVASHIKPWAVCKASEKRDENNGFILSPLFDTLFDKGFISFEEDGTLIISNWLSQDNLDRIDFKNYQSDLLHLTKERQMYLEYHRQYVFKK